MQPLATALPLFRITGAVAGGTVFGGGELIIRGGRIALWTARLLVDERLDAGHDGRSRKKFRPRQNQALGSEPQEAPPLAVSDQQNT